MELFSMLDIFNPAGIFFLGLGFGKLRQVRVPRFKIPPPTQGLYLNNLPCWIGFVWMALFWIVLFRFAFLQEPVPVIRVLPQHFG